MTLRISKYSSMAVTQLMRLMPPTLLSSRTSMPPSMLETRRNPTSQAAALRVPTSTKLGHPMEAVI
eukprot:8527165-Ditylum_brightwellii.AAC.1